MIVASVAPGSNQGQGPLCSWWRKTDSKISLGPSLLLLPMNIIIKTTLRYGHSIVLATTISLKKGLTPKIVGCEVQRNK